MASAGVPLSGGRLGCLQLHEDRDQAAYRLKRRELAVGYAELKVLFQEAGELKLVKGIHAQGAQRRLRCCVAEVHLEELLSDPYHQLH